MLKNKGIIIISVALCLMICTRIFAQNEISSPYSRYGVGLLTNCSNSTLATMGGVSYAMQSNNYINFRNPASYVAFDSLTFTGEVGFNINTYNLRTSSLRQNGTIGRLDYLTIGLPLTRHWRTSVGLIPFSHKGYNILDSREIDHIGNVNYTYSGEGGLMQLYWGNAFQLYKGLSIGLNVSYLWGNLSSIRYEEFQGDNFYNFRIAQNDYVDGIYLQAGLQYMAHIGENHKLGIGATYENSAYIWVKRDQLVQHYTGIYSSVYSYDTTSAIMGQKGNMRIPQSAGFGLSYSFKDKITVGTDVTWQNWAKYQCMGQGDSLKNAIISAIGIEYIPDPTSGKFGKNIALRLGGRYSTGYMNVRGTDIDEFAVSIGLGLPFRTFSSRFAINLMFEYSSLGTTKNNLIRQDYFKVGINMVLIEHWYQRMKLE